MPQCGPPTPFQAHHIKKGHYIMMKGRPCKITSVKISKTGKHGHAKVTFQANDIFTGQKFSDVQPGHANMLEPHPVKTTYELSYSDEAEQVLVLLNDDGEEAHVNAKWDDETVQKILEEEENGNIVMVTTLTAPIGEAEPYEYDEAIDSYKTVQE